MNATRCQSNMKSLATSLLFGVQTGRKGDGTLVEREDEGYAKKKCTAQD